MDPRTTQPGRGWLDHAGPFDEHPTPPLPPTQVGFPERYVLGPPRRRVGPLGWFVIVLAVGMALVVALVWLLGDRGL